MSVFKRVLNWKGKRLNEAGHEMPDPTPIAPPVGYKRQPSLADQIREMVRSERLAQEAAAAGYETFEEADDFDVGDDFDPGHPYDAEFDPPAVADVRRRVSRAQEDKLAADKAAADMKAAQPPKSVPAPKEPATPKNSE